MIKSILAIFFAVLFTYSYAQSDLNMTLVGQLPMPETTQDIWGFVDTTGIEYAVIGTSSAARIISLEDPANPKVVYIADGPTSSWRDIKYYNGYLYVTHDQGTVGLTIIDATSAPDTFSHTFWNPSIKINETTNNSLTAAHNVYIDEKGIMYIAGSRIGKRGVALFDLNEDPTNPTYLSRTNTFYSHDVFVQNNILYSSELTNGFGIYDVSDPSNPMEIGRGESSNDFTHNAWASEDGLTLYTTDEVSGGFLEAYDITVPAEPRFLDKYSPLDTRDQKIVIPHNAHVIDGYTVTSWYTDGVVINDMSRPENIIRVGQYDTYDNEASLNPGSRWFHGCWGAYPYLPSGLLITSDLERGLYVFDVDYQRASYLEGHVYAINSDGDTIPVVGATVEIMSDVLAFDVSNQKGEFKTGIAQSGNFLIKTSHAFYDSKNTNVVLSQGMVRNLDIYLSNQSYNSIIVDLESQLAIEAAKINISNFSSEADAELVASQEGTFTLTIRNQDDNRLTVSEWGHLSKTFKLDADNFLPEIIELSKGYSDNFASELGWIGVDSSDTGNWTRATPQEFFLNGDLASPKYGAPDDGDFKALISGNGGNQIGNDDIDGGETSIKSPLMNFNEMEAVTISYKTWFYNEGGDNTPDDHMSIVLGNGTDEIIIEEIEESSSVWSNLKSFGFSKSDIAFTDQMYVKVLAGDYGDPHIVKAGFDQFLVEDGLKSSNKNLQVEQLTIFPNPSKGPISFKLENILGAEVRISSILGATLVNQKLTTNSLDISNLPVGIYTIQIENEGILYVSKLIKH